MLLSVKHITDLTYSDFINESVMELRMAPRQEQFQYRLSFGLDIGPQTAVTSYQDWLGNTVHAFSINALHKQIQIIASSLVETDSRQNRLESFPDVWLENASFDYTLHDYLSYAGPIVDTPLLREVAHSVVEKAGNKFSSIKVGGLVLGMLRLINEKFVYTKGITNSASPITEVLEHGRGVCQDFTHLMIGLCRALNIPARYVSGYVHPDNQEFRGHTQTHAWVEVFFPSIGWIAVDPTNNRVVGENFVKIAIGRNFQDVPPNKGIYKGHADESIDVKVHTEELNVIPFDIAAERLGTLKIPIYAGARLDFRDQQREQEQQEQQEQQQQQ